MSYKQGWVAARKPRVRLSEILIYMSNPVPKQTISLFGIYF